MKKIITITAIMLMLFSPLTTIKAEAAEPLRLSIEKVNILQEKNITELTILANSTAEQLPAVSQLAATLGTASAEVTSVSEFGQTGDGTSYIFLVDVSGSITDKQIAAAKNTVTALVKQMSAGDNASVSTFGNDVYFEPVVSESGELAKQIDAIARKSDEDTNLYKAIVAALKYAAADQNVHDKKCVIVLSDGEDEFATGITKDEVTREIEAAHIPVFTVAMIGGKPSARLEATAKEFGSFARVSSGGKHYTHALSDADTLSVAADINLAIRKSYMIKAAIKEFTPPQNEISLTLTYTDPSDITVGDTIVLLPSLFAKDAEAQGTEASAASQSESSFLQRLPIYMWLALAVLILVIAVIVVFLRKKNHQKKRHEMAQTVALGGISEGTGNIGKTVAPAVNSTAAQELPKTRASNQLKLTLTKIGTGEVLSATITGTLTAGRSQNCEFSIPADDLISSKHFSVTNDDGTLYLQDLGSTNGTFVNGIPVSDRIGIASGDTVMFGAGEYRISW